MYIMERNKAAWISTAEALWNSEAVQCRRSFSCSLNQEEFIKRLDDGEVLSFGVIKVYKRNPEDKNILEAVHNTAKQHEAFYEAMANAIAGNKVKPL